MTVDEIRRQVAEIRNAALVERDDEKAHALEDDLYDEVLQAIARGEPNAKELAAEALQTQDLAFARHCA